MGAWGFGPFENDGASDWLAWAQDSADEAIDAAFAAAMTGSYLEVDEGQAALAAATLVAAAADGDFTDLPEQARALVFKRDNEDLEGRAINAIDAVLGVDSELASLRAEGSEADEWRAGVQKLRARLTAARERFQGRVEQ